MGSARARKSNLKRAFSVVDDSSLKSVKSIAIVDDVVTTMATVTALSHLLQNHGIRRISVWSLARACR
jgi:predicted amidophosphoribosyltransferase